MTPQMKAVQEQLVQVGEAAKALASALEALPVAAPGDPLWQFTTRKLLNELRDRAEKWRHYPGSGYLADRIDDAYCSLEGSKFLDGGRTPDE